MNHEGLPNPARALDITNLAALSLGVWLGFYGSKLLQETAKQDWYRCIAVVGVAATQFTPGFFRRLFGSGQPEPEKPKFATSVEFKCVPKLGKQVSTNVPFNPKVAGPYNRLCQLCDNPQEVVVTIVPRPLGRPVTQVVCKFNCGVTQARFNTPDVDNPSVGQELDYGQARFEFK